MDKSEDAAISPYHREVTRIVAQIPRQRFTTYGTIGRHLAMNPRRVASVLSGLTKEESARLPWHRVVAAEGRLSTGMPAELRERQKQRLESEGIAINERGYIIDPDTHFYPLRPNR